MDIPDRNSAVRSEYARAKEELTQHIGRISSPNPEEHARALQALDQYIEPTTEDREQPLGPELPQQPQRNNYAVLREEHARALGDLNQHIEQPAVERDEAHEVPELEPTRPTEGPHLLPGGPVSGGRVEQEAWALASIKAHHQRQAREALDRHIEESWENAATEITADRSPTRDPGVER